MTLEAWLMYLTLAIIATLTPGPAVLFIVTNTTRYGLKKSVFAALGNILGLFFLGLLAFGGLGTVLKTSELLFSIIKFIGSGYLIYLGLKLFFQKNDQAQNVGNRITGGNLPSWKIFSQAFGVAVSNPKAIVFLTALFPQFIDTSNQLLPQFIILITTLMLLSFFFLMLYAGLAHYTSSWLNNSRRIRSMNRASGTLFIGFGTLLAASSNS